MSVPSLFPGLKGYFGQIANFGVIGVLAGLLCWVVMFEIPSARQKFFDTLLKMEESNRLDVQHERQGWREELASQRAHSEQIAVSLVKSIDEMGRRIEANQMIIQKNQIEMIRVLQFYAPKSKDAVGPPTKEMDNFLRKRQGDHVVTE